MKPSPEAISTHHALSALHLFKLRILRALLVFGVSCLVLIWFFEAASGLVSPVDRLAYPLMLSVFSASLVALQVRPAMLPAVEWICFSSFAVFALINMASIVFALEAETSLYRMATLAQWLPLIYIVAFIFFDTREAVGLSSLIYLAFLAAVLWRFLSGRPLIAQDESFPILINMLGAHPIYIVTLTGVARLKTHFVDAKVDASLLSHAANVDYLTGVMSRRATAHELQSALAEALRAERCLAVLLIDIDHFKQVNDRFGHDAGDDVLVTVAAALREQLRPSDRLGRWGGEEFLIIARPIGMDAAIALSERLRAHIERLALPHATPVTLSVGVAMARPGDTPEALVKRADEALYRAKQRGRNRVIVETVETVETQDPE